MPALVQSSVCLLLPIPSRAGNAGDFPIPSSIPKPHFRLELIPNGGNIHAATDPTVFPMDRSGFSYMPLSDLSMPTYWGSKLVLNEY